MYQSFFLEDFYNIGEKPLYYSTIDELPDSFLRFIKRLHETIIVEDESTNIKYCNKCFNKLSESLYCDKCNINYNDINYETYYIDSIKHTDITRKDNYYYFKIYNDNIFLYKVSITTNIYSDNIIELLDLNDISISKDNIKYTRSIVIDSGICIKENEIIDLHYNKSYSYIEYHDKADFVDGYGYIYTDNLDLLKDTNIFKYKPLWKCIDYLKKDKVYIKDIIYYSLTNESFEYLVNYKLYKLAFSNFKYQGTFKKTFGVGKEFLDFMVKNNIDLRELGALKVLKVKDINLIRSISNVRVRKCLEKIKKESNINVVEVTNYFNEKNINLRHIETYKGYLEMLYELNFNMKDKKSLYPENFFEAYENLYEIYNSSIPSKIEKIGSILDVNRYEDNKYIIYPPKTIQSIFNEANQQRNCLIDYIDDYSKGQSQIYFLRAKKEQDKSLVTIEVRYNKVCQARAKFNNDPSNELVKVIKRWEKKLIPVSLNTEF